MAVVVFCLFVRDVDFIIVFVCINAVVFRSSDDKIGLVTVFFWFILWDFNWLYFLFISRVFVAVSEV